MSQIFHFHLLQTQKNRLRRSLYLPKIQYPGRLRAIFQFSVFFLQLCSGQPGNSWFTYKHPIGPVSIVTPWNFPAAMPVQKMVPALAAGCTVILKPSELTPLSALAHKIVAEEAGIPEGVLEICLSDRENVAEVGEKLFSDDRIKACTFTGSTATGKILLKHAAKGIKKCCMELGGLSPFILFESCDVEQAVEDLMGAKFRNSGQVCIAANRIFIHSKIYDQAVNLLEQKIKALQFGPPELETTTIGPVINSAAVKRMGEIVEDAKKKGAEVKCGGGRRLDLGELFFDPTLILDVNNEMMAWGVETFGPILSVGKFDDEVDVVRQANEGSHGLVFGFQKFDL